MVEGARLESVYTPKAYRGFESLSLRHYLFREALSIPIITPLKAAIPHGLAGFLLTACQPLLSANA